MQHIFVYECPRHIPPKRFPWWISECAEVITTRKKNLKIYQGSTIVADKIGYNRTRAVAKMVKMEARQQYWRQSVDNTNADALLSKVWARILKMSGSTLSLPRLTHINEISNSKHVQTSSQITSAKNFCNEFLTNNDFFEKSQFSFTSECQEQHNEPIIILEIRSVMMQC